MAKERSFLQNIIIALVAGGLTLFGVYYGAKWTRESQLTLTTIQKQKQLFGQLMGQRESRTRLYKSYVETSVRTDHNQVLWENAAQSDLKSLYLQQATFFRQIVSNLVLKIAENDRQFFEIIGEIWVYFPNTPKLIKLIEPIYLQKQLTVPTLEELKGKKMTPPAFESWQNDSIKKGKEFVEKEYARPIDHLLEYMLEIVKSEPKE